MSYSANAGVVGNPLATPYDDNFNTQTLTDYIHPPNTQIAAPLQAHKTSCTKANLQKSCNFSYALNHLTQPAKKPDK